MVNKSSEMYVTKKIDLFIDILICYGTQNFSPKVQKWFEINITMNFPKQVIESYNIL